MTDLLIDGPTNAPVHIILAHGAGAPMDSPFMDAFAAGLARHGLRCVRFEFPYMAQRRTDGKKRPPNPAPVLLQTWRDVLSDFASLPLVIGGKSMGGRMASMLAREREDSGNPLKGLVCLGYPFHPPGKPEKTRTEHLKDIQTPTLIIQGERDTLGNRDEISRYRLSAAIRFAWMPDGDHGFKPRKASGHSEKENLNAALETLVRFTTML